MSERNTLIPSLLAIFILSVSVDHLYDGRLFGVLNVSVQTFSMFLGLFYAAFFSIWSGKLYIDGNNNILRIVLFLLFIAFVFQAIRSEDYFRSLTYLAMLFINIFVFAVFSERLGMISVKRANNSIYILGVMLLGIIFAKYLYVIIFQASEILADRERWEVGSSDVYEVLFGRYIAFQAYAGDPNVVGMAIAGIVFCGMYVASVKKSGYIHLINVILILMIFVSFSRGAIISFLLVLFFCGFVLNKKEYKHYSVIFAVLLLFGFLLSPIFIAEGYSAFNPLSKFSHSISRRADEWGFLFAYWIENPLLGGGLRYDELLLGKYAENSYLGLLVNTGIFGAVLFFLAISLVYFSSLVVWLKKRDEVVFPWIAYATYLIISMGFVSMEVKPHLWVTLSVLAAFSFGQSWCIPRYFSRVKNGN